MAEPKLWAAQGGALAVVVAVGLTAALLVPAGLEGKGAASAIAGNSAMSMPAWPATQRPASFERNAGQWDAAESYRVQGAGVDASITPTSLSLAVHQSPSQDHGPTVASDSRVSLEAPPLAHVVTMRFVGAGVSKVSEGPKQAQVSNYFLGATAITGVPHFDSITYAGIYPGIDVLYHGTADGQLKYDLRVDSGASPEQVVLAFEGAQSLAVDAGGGLEIRGPTTTLHMAKPETFQLGSAALQSIASRFVLHEDGTAGFALGAYDATKPLTIDPLVYSTNVGGTSYDYGLGIAADTAGNAYITGYTGSANFPVVGSAYQPSKRANQDAYVMKLSPAGSVVYSTFIGGASTDLGYAIAIDGAGNAYITGLSYSADYPTTAGAYQTVLSPPFGDPFVTKLNPTGSALVYSTFVGGTNGANFGGLGIALDSTNAAYITGTTASPTWPTTAGAPQTTYAGGGDDAFVAKLNPTGSALVYSTYLGGAGDDQGHGIAVDASGNAYVAGLTSSATFPTTAGAYRTAMAGCYDAFVTKVNAAGTAWGYSTYVGGTSCDEAMAVAVDASGSAYITGGAASLNYPTTGGSYQPANPGGENAFVTKLAPSGASLVYSTFLGGLTFDYGQGIAVDSSGSAYVAGRTDATNFPITPATAVQTTNAGSEDVFVARLDPPGATLLYGTYLGSSSQDQGLALATSGGFAYVTGVVGGPGFPTTPGAFQPAWAGGLYDAFAVRIGVAPTPSCGPASQTVVIGAAASFTVTSGMAPYAWTAPGSNNPGPVAGAAFSTTYTTAASYTVSVADATAPPLSSQCTVTVTNPPPTAPPRLYQAMLGLQLQTAQRGPTWSLLAQANDPHGDPMSAALCPATGPAQGILTGGVAADGNFVYAPSGSTPYTTTFQYKVTDTAGLQSPCALVTIRVNPDTPPRADFQASPMTVTAGNPVSFVDASTDADAQDWVAAWSWNFGDGNTASQPNPSHIFGNPGSPQACLSITDSWGKSSTVFCRTITVVAPGPGNPGSGTGPSPGSGGSEKPPQEGSSDPGGGRGISDPPPLAVDAGPSQTVAAGAIVQLRASAAGGPTTTFRWLQTSGATVTLEAGHSPTPSFTAPGTDAQLYFQVDASDGARTGMGGVMVTIHAANAPPLAKLAPDVEARVGDAVTLDASASMDPEGDALSYKWTQWNGAPLDLQDATAPKASFVATAAGTFVLAVEVSDGKSSSIGVQTVNVTPRAATHAAPPALAFAADVAANGTVTVTPAMPGPTYTWQFGDGTLPETSSGPKVHHYASPGDYTIRMTSSTASTTAEATRQITVGASASRDAAATLQNPSGIPLWALAAGGLMFAAATGMIAAAAKRQRRS